MCQWGAGFSQRCRRVHYVPVRSLALGVTTCVCVFVGRSKSVQGISVFGVHCLLYKVGVRAVHPGITPMILRMGVV